MAPSPVYLLTSMTKPTVTATGLEEHWKMALGWEGPWKKVLIWADLKSQGTYRQPQISLVSRITDITSESDETYGMAKCLVPPTQLTVLCCQKF